MPGEVRASMPRIAASRQAFADLLRSQTAPDLPHHAVEQLGVRESACFALGLGINCPVVDASSRSRLARKMTIWRGHKVAASVEYAQVAGEYQVLRRK